MSPADLNPELRGTSYPGVAMPSMTPPVPVPKGPRLKLAAVLNYVLLDMPDEKSPDSVGGIIMPAGYQKPFEMFGVVEVLAVGPDVRTVKPGQRVLICKPQCEQAFFDGNAYFRTTEQAIAGIVMRPPIENPPFE